MNKERARSETSALEQERQALLQKALDRPGIPEVMKLYEAWQKQDKGLNTYRAATRRSFKITVTNHANA